MEALIFHPDKVFILEGKWKGKGKHITKIETEYEEELIIQKQEYPVFSYSSNMTSDFNGHKLPNNNETGFIKLLENGSKIELSICHKQQICEISEGTISDKEVNLEAKSITRSNSAQQECNLYQTITRKYSIEENAIKYEILMTTFDNNEHKFVGKLINDGLKVYWQAMCAPSRAVVSLCKEANLQHQLIYVELLKAEQLQAWFLELNPKHQVPVIKDSDFILTESTTILKYLSLCKGLPSHWYPQQIEIRAKIDEFIDWYQGTLSKSTFQLVANSHCYQKLGKVIASAEEIKKMQADFNKMLVHIDKCYLKPGKSHWICGAQEPTIADILGVADIVMAMLAGEKFENFPRIQKWIFQTFQLEGVTKAHQHFIKVCSQINPEGIKIILE